MAETHCQMCDIFLRRLYEAEKKLEERNYAHDHPYAEWREVVLAGSGEIIYSDDRGHHIIEGEKVPWAEARRSA